MDGGAWQATVHRFARSQTRLSDFTSVHFFLTLGGVVRVACQGFLVTEACVSVLVGGAGFLLSGVQ